MSVIEFIEHEGVRILRIDFSRCETEAYLGRIELAARTIRAEPEYSVLTLTILRETEYNQTIVEQMKAYVAGNRPYVVAGASPAEHPVRMFGSGPDSFH